MSTAIICGILILICVIGVRSSVKRVAHGCCGSGGDEVKRVKIQDKDTAHYPWHGRLEVRGMTCGNCKKRVENAFHEREGFYAVADVKKNQVTIHMKRRTDPEELRRIVRKAGYEPGKYEEQ